MIHANLVVWIDKHEAKVFAFIPDLAEGVLLSEPGRSVLREAAPSEFAAAPLEYAYLERVRQALADAGGILIAGPGAAKAELVAHLRQHDPVMARRIWGVEPLDRSGDGRLVTLARRVFATGLRPPNPLASAG